MNIENELNEIHIEKRNEKTCISGLLLFSLASIAAFVICILTILVGYGGKFILEKIM